MTDVLEFHTHPVYDELRWKKLQERLEKIPEGQSKPLPLTNQELNKLYFNETQSHCLKLVRFYKATGKWNKELDKRMVSVVKELQAICTTLSEMKETKYDIDTR